jgi:hypothetical protein
MNKWSYTKNGAGFSKLNEAPHLMEVKGEW